MCEFFLAVCDIPFSVFGDDEFCQITYITNKAEGNFLAGPCRAIKFLFFRFVLLADFDGTVDDFLEFHYLSSKSKLCVKVSEIRI